MTVDGTSELLEGSLAAKRYRQFCDANIPSACAEKLISRLKEPAPCKEGMHAGPPDFIGIGAMKSGTSWWYSLLVQHPQIYAPKWRKELHFFDLLIGTPYGEEQVSEYHSLFCRPPGRLTGEWTPRYLSDFWIPAAMHRAAPEAKLLVMLRDPVNRFVSGVTHQIVKEVPRKITIIDMWSSHFARGLYHDQLSRYLKMFPREQLLVLQYERCVEDPYGELRRTFDFLGLEMPAIYTEEKLRTQRNVTKAGVKITLPPHIRESLIQNYQEDVRNLFREYPDIRPELWPHFRSLP